MSGVKARNLISLFTPRRSERDERGAILVLAAFGIVVAVIAASLAVDLGQVGQERRRNQKVADLAALDASRNVSSLAAAQAAAEASAKRNGFDVTTDPDKSILVVFGTKSGGSCVTSGSSGTKVCVTVTSKVDYAFTTGDKEIVATAQAGDLTSAGFTLGTTLASASLDTASELPIMNGIIGKMLNPSGTLNIVSYSGLATADVGLSQLKTALGFGTLNELLTSNIKLADLLTASALVLNNQGTAASIAAATKVTQMKAILNNTTQFKLGDYLKVASGYEDTALNGSINALQLITAGLQLANKNNFINAGALLSVPNPLNAASPAFSTKVGLKVIEGPQLYIGGTDGTHPHAKTAQVELTITPTVDLTTSTALLNLAGISIGTTNIRINGDVPVKLSGAAAQANLTDIRCTGSQGITVQVQRQALTTTVSSATLNVYLSAAAIAAANVKASVTVTGATATVAAPASADTLTFSYPSEFSPTYAGKSTASSPVNVSLTTSGGSANTTATVGVAGLTVVALISQLGLANLLTTIVNPIISPVINSAIGKVTDPVLKALGLSVGTAFVTAPSTYFDPTKCGIPGLQA